MNDMSKQIIRKVVRFALRAYNKFIRTSYKFLAITTEKYSHASYLSARRGPYTIVGVASIPDRIKKLKVVVASLQAQADEIHVYLNGYDSVPEFLVNRKGVYYYTSQEYGDLNDRGKFYAMKRASEKKALFVTVDDDIYYPPDYISRLSRKLIIDYKRKAAVGVHGVYYPQNAKGFFHRNVLHFSREILVDAPVSLLGTGTLAFYPSEIPFSMEDMPTGGKADIWFALYAKKCGVPLVSISRKKDWLVEIKSKGKGDAKNHSEPEEVMEKTLYLQTKSCSKEHDKLVVSGKPWGGKDILNRLDKAGLKCRFSLLVLQALEDASNISDMAKVVSRKKNLVHGLSVKINSESFIQWFDFYAKKGEVEVGSYALLMQRISRFHKKIYTEEMKKKNITGYYLIKKREVELGGGSTKNLLELLKAGRRAGQAYESAMVAKNYVEKYSCSDIEVQLNICVSFWESGRRDEAAKVYANLSEASACQTLYAVMGILCACHNKNKTSCMEMVRWMMNCLGGGANHDAIKLLDWLSVKINDFDRLFETKQDVVKSNSETMRLLKQLNKAYRDPLSKIIRELGFEIEFSEDLIDPFIRPHEAGVKKGNEFCALYYTRESSEDLASVFLKGEKGSICFPKHGSCFFNRLTQADITLQPVEENKGLEKVSVIITAYNAGATLGYSIESILKQTYKNIEIVIVSDCCGDNTVDVVKQYQSENKNIKLVMNKENKGPYESRNIAINHAAGKYFALQDADDYSHPERISKQVEYLKKNSSAIVSLCRHVRVDKSGMIRLENNGSIIGDGPMTLCMSIEDFDRTGLFLPVRTRGDVEFYSRIKSMFGDQAIEYVEEVLLLGLHARISNSFVETATEEKKISLANFKKKYSEIHQKNSSMPLEIIKSLEDAFGCNLHRCYSSKLFSPCDT